MVSKRKMKILNLKKIFRNRKIDLTFVKIRDKEIELIEVKNELRKLENLNNKYDTLKFNYDELIKQNNELKKFENQNKILLCEFDKLKEFENKYKELNEQYNEIMKENDELKQAQKKEDELNDPNKSAFINDFVNNNMKINSRNKYNKKVVGNFKKDQIKNYQTTMRTYQEFDMPV